ncbi:MAG: carboxypeptidase regulatory-like domain-containing protein [Acidobacteria bacterium]|nr:carboxypeptidase regulatory-like domain-containing protein [Acidobacteriota bacterium]
MKRRLGLWLTASSFTLLLIACGGGEKPTETAESKPAETAGPVTMVDPATAATITGKVSFEGEKPKPRQIRMDAEASCASLHKAPVYGEEVVVNDNKTLQYVFVYVKEGLGDKTFVKPTEPVVLDQKGCLYTPHMIGVQAGQTVKILNSDPTTHNIHPVPANNREWNTSMSPGGSPLERTFAREEVMIPVKCNVHPWMKSYIGVLKHPFFAVTGRDGTFEIKGLPPGEYTIEAWHEKLGATTQKVTLIAKDSKVVDFTLKGTT